MSITESKRNASYPAAQRRVLAIVPVSDAFGGVRSVVANYANALSDTLCFDFLSYASSAFEGVGNPLNRTFEMPRKGDNPFAFRAFLDEFFKTHAGEYSALWLNASTFSNLDYLDYAKKYGIGRRILHTHGCIPTRGVKRIFAQRNFAKLDKLATDKWACSQDAGVMFFQNPNFTVVPNAIDTKKYQFNQARRDEMRSKLNITDKFVVGTVGRLSPEKGQDLLVDTLASMVSRNNDTVLLLLGDGPERANLEKLASSRSLTDHILFLGNTIDPSTCLSAFDVFAFPSHREGFGIALLEAQANGLPCVISREVPDAAIVSNVTRVGNREPNAWCDAVIARSRNDVRICKEKMQHYDLAVQAPILLRRFIGDCL